MFNAAHVFLNSLFLCPICLLSIVLRVCYLDTGNIYCNDELVIFKLLAFAVIFYFYI